MTGKNLIASVEQIESRIFLIRGQKVMLDSDLAELYGVQTKVLNQAVKRNIERFPSDFTRQLTATKKTGWSQIVTTSPSSSIRQPYRMPSQSTAHSCWATF